jgi:hypothetical protein
MQPGQDRETDEHEGRARSTDVVAIALTVVSALSLLVLIGAVLSDRGSSGPVGSASLLASPAASDVAPSRDVTEPPVPVQPSQPPSPSSVPLCGAPVNPFGYSFCGSTVITNPDPLVCSYFDCDGSFWRDGGWMTQCRDGAFSMSGGRVDACSGHGGPARLVYRPG